MDIPVNKPIQKLKIGSEGIKEYQVCWYNDDNRCIDEDWYAPYEAYNVVKHLYPGTSTRAFIHMENGKQYELKVCEKIFEDPELNEMRIVNRQLQAEIRKMKEVIDSMISDDRDGEIVEAMK